ncbi:helix-turn-helix domain-containing protein [Providencia hangzhouensis]|uniref:helix-turn-helix domain-containing protein n=1 Tax=Providencia hangzhouensis TaxID=3031799 RepID=UPI0034DDB4AF
METLWLKPELRRPINSSRAVVDYGGFAQAAEILHRTQSSISYTISKLEQTFKIEIFS